MPTVRRTMMMGCLWTLVLALDVQAQTATILDRLPTRIDERARYVIYLHGRIIEDQGRRPTHPVWGVYEYQQILESLAADDVTVVSEQRAPNTDMNAFAGHVADQVRQLLRAGVRPERISVVGFSKGGGIAMRVSALLENPRVTFVLLAACGDGDFSGSDLRLWGRVLSVYEASDDIGRSCTGLFARSGSTGERSEIRIDTGEQHGAFFRPRAEWVDPVRRWIRES